MSFPTRQVDRVDVLVPPGNNGQVGFQIANAGIPVIPYNTGAFLFANGELLAMPLIGAITSGSWQLIAYNTGQFDHKLFVRFYLTVIYSAGGVDMAQTVSQLAGLSAPPAGAGVEVSPELVAATTAPTLADINPPPTGPFVGPPPLPPPRP